MLRCPFDVFPPFKPLYSEALWEDAYERQQGAAEARRAAAKKSAPGDRERGEREESLRLNKARLDEQLGRATNPARRAMLERALKALDGVDDSA